MKRSDLCLSKAFSNALYEAGIDLSDIYLSASICVRAHVRVYVCVSVLLRATRYVVIFDSPGGDY